MSELIPTGVLVNIEKLWTPKWVITKQDSRSNEVIDVLEVEGNVILYQGLAALYKVLADVGPAFSPIYNNANAFIGAGTSSASSGDQSQTGLLGTTAWKGMEAGYPQTQGTNNENLVFQAKFLTGEAEFAWNEIALGNAADGGTEFNRLVQSLGNKIANQTWTVDLILQG